jgi:hypothetical protein
MKLITLRKVLEKLIFAKIFKMLPQFTEHESTLSCLQEHTAMTYPKPNQ